MGSRRPQLAVGWARKSKMSVFSRFSQKFAAFAAKSRQFSTSLKKRKIMGIDLSHLHVPWDSTMNVQASQWYKWRFVDVAYFWSTVWAVPLGLIVAYNTIFIGPAVLKPIPEGYEPEEWEYERYPITRWLIKNVNATEQCVHELCMDRHRVEKLEIKQRQLMAEVRRLINQDGDYAAYGYLPYSARQTRIVNEIRERHYREAGSYD